MLAKKGTFFKKRVIKSFTTSYLIPFQSVLYQNKALHNFHKKGQHPIARHMKGLD